MGVDATGQVFNSIVAVEQYKGNEMNAMVNPGAIAATSMVRGADRDEIWKKILGSYSDFAGRPLSVNQEVFKSEADTNQRNQAIAMLMHAYGHIKAEPAARHRHLHRAVLRQRQREGPGDDGGDLANGGKNPVTGKQVIKTDNVPEILAVMATAGLYDDSGKWLFTHGPAGQERRGRRHHRRVAGQVRHRASSRRRSTRRATACARRGRSPTSPTRSAAIPWRPGRGSPQRPDVALVAPALPHLRGQVWKAHTPPEARSTGRPFFDSERPGRARVSSRDRLGRPVTRPP